MIETMDYLDETYKWIKSSLVPGKIILDDKYIDDDGIIHPIISFEKSSYIPLYGETKKGSSIVSSVKTPDFIFYGEKWDLKTPRCGGKNIVVRYLKKKSQRKQATNIIIDISNIKESNSYVLKLVEEQLVNPQRMWVNRIMIFKNYKIIKVYKKI